MERLWSVTDETSEIARLNANGEAAISPDTEAILSFALNMCVDTDGALDITMYPISRAWGFTTGEYRVPAQEEIIGLLDVDYRRVNVSDGTASIDAGCMVYLGSVAKGWATNELVQLLEDAGIKSGLLDLGGNIYCIGSRMSGGAKWKIALKDPLGDEYCAALGIKATARW